MRTPRAPADVPPLGVATRQSSDILARRFRQLLDCSPRGLIRRMRRERVKQLPTDTELRVVRISQSAGFKHMEHKYAVFIRETKR